MNDNSKTIVEETVKTEETGKYIVPEHLKEKLKKITDPESRLMYKITIARKMFKDCDVKKSGKNKFQGFSYFELGDFIPHCKEIECELMLCSTFHLKNKKGILKVKDCEPISDEIQGTHTFFIKERPDGKEGGNFNQQVQGIGKISTYIKRYCYLDYLNIVEPDTIDSEDNTEKKTKPKTSPKKTLKKQMVLDEVKQYLSENLDDQTDMVTAKKLLDELKMQKKINQAVYNKMCSDIERASK